MPIKHHNFKKISKKRMQKKQTKLFAISGAILAFFIFILWFLTYSSYFKISKILISGNKKIQSQDIQNYFNDYLKNRSIIPLDNLVFFQNKNFNKGLQERFLIIKGVQIKKIIPNQIKINIQERPETLIWCQDFQISSTSSQETMVVDQCFFTDEQGIIFQETDKTAFFLISGQNSKKIGEQVIDRNLLQTIIDVENQCQTKAQIQTESAKIISENQINFKTKQGWEIYINPKKTIDTQITALKSILDLKIPAEKRNKLEYIDLRFETVSIYPNLLKND